MPYRSSTAEVKIYPTRPMTFDAHKRLFLNPPRAARLGDGQVTGQVPPPNTKPGLNIAFIHQFLSLLSIMVPHWNSKESGLLFSQGLFLLLRTYLSLVVTRLDGEIVRDLVAGNGRSFLWGIVKWCGVGGMFHSGNREDRTSIDFSRLCIVHQCCYQVSPEQSLHSFPYQTHSIYPRPLSERQSQLLQAIKSRWWHWPRSGPIYHQRSDSIHRFSRLPLFVYWKTFGGPFRVQLSAFPIFRTACLDRSSSQLLHHSNGVASTFTTVWEAEGCGRTQRRRFQGATCKTDS